MAAPPTAHARRRRLAAIILAVGAAAQGGPAGADAGDTLALAVKATYLYKLPAFVAWPNDAFASPPAAFTLCVVGNDPFGDLLDKAVTGQRLTDRPVRVLRVETATHESPCQLMYITGGQQTVPQALQAVAGTPVLTVTDSAPEGSKGIVNFVLRDNHVRLEIDQAAASRSRLDISSKLLSVAVSVTPK